MTSGAVGVRAVAFALSGFIVQLSIVLLIGFGGHWRDFLDAVLTSFAGLVIASFLLGYLSSRTLTSLSTSRFRACTVGALVGWLALFAQTLTGSSVGYFANLSRDQFAFLDYIVKPTFWVILLGSLPAIIIGVIFGIWIWESTHSKAR
jgi:hypothetical protein